MVELDFQDNIDYKKLGFLLPDHNVAVGFISGDMHAPDENGVSVDMADLARRLSEGDPATHLPARPFLEDGIAEGRDVISDAIEEYFIHHAETGKETKLKRIVAITIGAISEFVHGSFYKETAPNSPATIEAKKGGDQPLIDSAQMINSMVGLIDGDRVE